MRELGKGPYHWRQGPLLRVAGESLTGPEAA